MLSCGLDSSNVMLPDLDRIIFCGTQQIVSFIPEVAKVTVFGQNIVAKIRKRRC